MECTFCSLKIDRFIGGLWQKRHKFRITEEISLSLDLIGSNTVSMSHAYFWIQSINLYLIMENYIRFDKENG